MQAGRLQSCSHDFRLKVAKFRFIPISEAAIEGKHQKVTTSHKKSSAMNRMDEVMQFLLEPEALDSAAAAFSQARRLASVPELLGCGSHPLIQSLRNKSVSETQVKPEPSSYVKPLTAIIYNTDYSGQFLDTTSLKKQHDKKMSEDHLAASRATQVDKKEKVSWELTVFWEHARVKAGNASCFLSLPQGGQAGSMHSVKECLTPLAKTDLVVQDAGAGLDDDAGEVPHSQQAEPQQLAEGTPVFVTILKSKPADAKQIYVHPG